MTVTNSEQGIRPNVLFPPAFRHENITLRFSQQGEKTTMKRTLLAVFAALLFLNTLAMPIAAHADGGSGGGGCNPNDANCKPVAQ
jgi:hypothetical protein